MSALQPSSFAAPLPRTAGNPLLAAAIRAGKVANAESAALLTRLDLSNVGLTHLDGIGVFLRLEELDLSGNRIVDLRPLSALTHLRTLDLSDNGLRSLAGLPNLPSLTLLNLRENRLQDVAPLAKLARLRDVDLDDNPVSEMPLAASPLLESDDFLELDPDTQEITVRIHPPEIAPPALCEPDLASLEVPQPRLADRVPRPSTVALTHLAVQTRLAEERKKKVVAEVPAVLVTTKGRRPWLAAVLSLAVPGLGQLYNGQVAKGLLWLGASLLTCNLAGAMPLLAAVDAARVAGRHRVGAPVAAFTMF